MMGRNFDEPQGEIASRHHTDGTRNDKGKGGRIAALAFAVAAGASIVASPSEAEAQTGATFEWEKLDVTLHGTVAGSILHIAGETGGWFNKSKGVVRIPLEGILTPEALAALEGKEVDVEIEGKSEDGVFKPIVKIRTQFGLTLPASFSLNDLMRAGLTPPSCTRPDCTPRPRDCSWPPCRGVRRSAAPTKPPLSPEPSSAEFGEAGVRFIKSLKPFDPGTFYADKPEAGKDMGEGHPRGFDIKKGESLTFFVTGDPSGKTSVSLELYPWVSTDEKKRGAEKLTVKVNIDGEEFEIVPQSLPKGKVLPSSETGENSLLATPVKLPRIPVLAGTLEFTVTPDGYDVRAVLRGATETVKPNIDPAIEYAFEEDPAAPPEFSVNARLITAADAPSGYALEPITPSQVKINFPGVTDGFNIRIQRLPNSPLVLVHLEKGKKGEVDYAAYVSEKPLEPETDYRVRFTRVAPAARSYNAAGSPEELVLHVRATVDAATGLVTAFEIDKSATAPQLPGTMTCNVNNVAGANPKRAHLFCAEEAADESRIRALRARMDNRPTNPTGKFRRHVLRAY